MTATLKTKATVEDYSQLPEGADYQLIDGEIIEMPSPKFTHQQLSTLIIGKLYSSIYSTKKGELISAPFDVHLDEENVYQPDILFVSAERLGIIDKWIYGAPDVVIEILSESTIYYDNYKKFHNYEKHGVKEYFLINPENFEVICYKPDINGRYKEFYREYNQLKSSIMDCDIELMDKV